LTSFLTPFGTSERGKPNLSCGHVQRRLEKYPSTSENSFYIKNVVGDPKVVEKFVNNRCLLSGASKGEFIIFVVLLYVFLIKNPISPVTNTNLQTAEHVNIHVLNIVLILQKKLKIKLWQFSPNWQILNRIFCVFSNGALKNALLATVLA